MHRIPYRIDFGYHWIDCSLSSNCSCVYYFSATSASYNSYTNVVFLYTVQGLKYIVQCILFSNIRSLQYWRSCLTNQITNLSLPIHHLRSSNSMSCLRFSFLRPMARA